MSDIYLIKKAEF